jgi:hypothetical protein
MPFHKHRGRLIPLRFMRFSRRGNSIYRCMICGRRKVWRW